MFHDLGDDVGGLCDGVQEEDLIIVDRVAEPQAFRGHEFGLLLAAEALTDLSAGCAMSANVPAPFELAFDAAG